MARSAKEDQHLQHSLAEKVLGTHYSPEQIHKDDESHREETKTAHLGQKQQFHEVVNRRVDPSSPLTQQHVPSTGRDGVGYSVGSEFHLKSGKVFHHECRQIPIFTEREQVLLMKRINIGLGVLIDDE